MDAQLLYQQDVTMLNFEAEVVELLSLPAGRTGIVLDRTYFYPTGGGQEHDTGTIGFAPVIDVYKDEARDCLVHVVNGVVELGSVKASIDAERRLRHMQHHTAQHLLTQCILRQTGFETVSANINGYTPATLDILAAEVKRTDLDQAEQMANQIIYEDRQVKNYFVTPKELSSIPLRRPPKVSENIRIVEIDSFDYSPCGGTHVLQTGSIGLVKIVKAEKQGDKQRIHFIAGIQAMQVFSNLYASLMGLANKLSMSWQDIPELVDRQAEQLSVLQKELENLRKINTVNEAHQLTLEAKGILGAKLVKAQFTNRPIGELRLLAEELKKVPDVIAYLASYDGQKVSLIITCGEATGRDARQLLSLQLSSIHGRGGGDGRLAQGGGVTTPEQFSTFLDKIDLV